MGKAIFFGKGSLLNKILVKALEAVKAGQKWPFFNFSLLIKLNFFYRDKNLLDFLDFDLILVNFIMQNFQVTRE